MAAATTANVSKTSLKLMVHKDENKVIFAEANSDFVDALFSFMTLPMGTIVRLLEKCPDEKLKAIGSLNNLYKSLVDLPNNYLSIEENRVMILNTRSSSYNLCRNLKLNVDDTEPIKYYICPVSSCHLCDGAPFSTWNLARCTKCTSVMNKEIKEEKSTAVEDCVFVSDVTTYIVTDDLHVIPNAADFGLKLLCDLGFTDVNLLEEMTFDVDIEQILILLKGALVSKYSLTYMVFNSTHHRDRKYLKPTFETLIQPLTSNESVTTTSEKIMLKLHLQKSTSKFLFAEAKEDFVEFLLGFLEIPLGTIIGKLMAGNSSIESLDNLYASILNMDVGYIKSQDVKNVLLEPHLPWHYVSRNKMFSLNISNCPQVYSHSYYLNTRSCYSINIRHIYLAHDRSVCSPPFSHDERCYRLTLFKDPRLQGRILKAPGAKFTLTDDLVLTPSSSISTIAMLKNLNVSLNDSQEHEVSIGMEEGLNILKASLRSLSTLSDALLKEDNQSKPEK